MKNLMIALTLVLVSTHAYAGRESGGGNAVVCFDDASIASRLRTEKAKGGGWIDDMDIPHITSVELLDFYEAKNIVDGFPGNQKKVNALIEARPGETVEQYTERLFSRFKDLLPKFYYTKDGTGLFKSYRSFPRGLEPIDDVEPGANVNSSHCVRATILAQYEKNGEVFVGYDARIFNLDERIFSVTDRALSFLHENLYRLAKIYRRAQTSDTTRTLIGRIVSENTTLKEMQAAILNSIDTAQANYIYPGYSVSNVQSFIESFYLLDVSSRTEGKALTKSLLQSVASFEEECAKKEVEPVKKAIMEAYNKSWRKALLELKGVPQEVLLKLDETIQSFSWIRAGVESDVNPFGVKQYYCMFNTDVRKIVNSVPDLALPKAE